VTGVYYDYVSLCSRYSILDPYCSRGAIGRAVWLTLMLVVVDIVVSM